MFKIVANVCNSFAQVSIFTFEQELLMLNAKDEQKKHCLVSETRKPIGV